MPLNDCHRKRTTERKPIRKGIKLGVKGVGKQDLQTPSVPHDMAMMHSAYQIVVLLERLNIIAEESKTH